MLLNNRCSPLYGMCGNLSRVNMAVLCSHFSQPSLNPERQLHLQQHTANIIFYISVTVCACMICKINCDCITS
jgi:hypothetical protein